MKLSRRKLNLIIENILNEDESIAGSEGEKGGQSNVLDQIQKGGVLYDAAKNIVSDDVIKFIFDETKKSFFTGKITTKTKSEMSDIIMERHKSKNIDEFYKEYAKIIQFIWTSCHHPPISSTTHFIGFAESILAGSAGAQSQESDMSKPLTADELAAAIESLPGDADKAKEQISPYEQEIINANVKQFNDAKLNTELCALLRSLDLESSAQLVEANLEKAGIKKQRPLAMARQIKKEDIAKAKTAFKGKIKKGITPYLDKFSKGAKRIGDIGKGLYKQGEEAVKKSKKDYDSVKQKEKTQKRSQRDKKNKRIYRLIKLLKLDLSDKWAKYIKASKDPGKAAQVCKGWKDLKKQGFIEDDSFKGWLEFYNMLRKDKTLQDEFGVETVNKHLSPDMILRAYSAIEDNPTDIKNLDL